MSNFALVDCNNFFASCERIFRPDLKNKPVIVLSNNDGCVIARSPEAKLLGIPMAKPYFKIKDLITKNKIEVFSSNFSLYSDISKRVMDILGTMSSQIEIYSIDEAFLDFSGDFDQVKHAEQIYSTIKQYLGIPVTIGIGRTKTLAKIANIIAKKHSKNVFLLNKENEDEVLANVPIEEIWGIGWRWAKILRIHNIRSALELRDACSSKIRSILSVIGLKTQAELKGRVCLNLEELQDKKSITVSRSFGKTITEYEELKEPIVTYISRACEKLRRAKLLASHMIIFISTNRFSEFCYRNSASIALPFPSNYTPEIIKLATAGLNKIYKKGFRYNKAGVIFTSLSSKDKFIPCLLDNRDNNKNDSLMNAIDLINYKYKNNIVKFLGSGIEQPWQNNRQLLSPSYTTKWNDILSI